MNASGGQGNPQTPERLAVSPAAAILWGKSRRQEDGSVTYHPLVCHMIDVAIVAQVLSQEVLTPATRSWLGSDLGLADDDVVKWVAFLAGLHDCAKASVAFASKQAAAETTLRSSGFSFPPPRLRRDAPHGTMTAANLPAILQSEFGLSRDMATRLAIAVGGHHGTFAKCADLEAVPTSAIGTGLWHQARIELVQVISELLGMPGAARPQKIGNAQLMFLAGLVSVADWIGSADEHFPHETQDLSDAAQIDLLEYAGRSRIRAGVALKRLGWTGWSPLADPMSFENLFGVGQPRPVQEEVISLAKTLSGPGIVIIEVPTGEGKSEAGMVLADHWTVSCGQRGCYFALPTRATSDQMFGRVRDFLSRRYPATTVSLQLLHGHAALSAEFEELKHNHDKLFHPSDIYDRPGTAPDNVVAAEWFLHRKRGLLSPYGVGTVDQTLLAALQTPHVFVRLFGLAGKTVIIDEVHAYDIYMTSLLKRLLEWLGALGSSVVLLSATLPARRRMVLLEAYATGAGLPPVQDSHEARYPRITWASMSGSGAKHVETSPGCRKSVSLRWVDGNLPADGDAPFELGERLRQALADGGCAAVICNTVGRAQQMFAALKVYFPGLASDGAPEIDILHGRYTYEEREQREKRTLLRFGKAGAQVTQADGTSSPVRRPYRAVLVATQIIEQSLDLDFDLMISDLAPVDLLIQRAGRLHRHSRPDRPAVLSTPELWLVAPNESNGVPDFDPGSAAVYPPHLLLRSWLELKTRPQIRVPEDVEHLVEAVYHDGSQPASLPAELEGTWNETWDKLQSELKADEREAEERWIKRPAFVGEVAGMVSSPLAEDRPDFHQAHQALTRLSDPSVDVVFLFGTEKQPSFDPGGRDTIDVRVTPTVLTAKRLLGRSMSVIGRHLVPALIKQTVPQGWQRSPLLRNHRLVVLDEQGCAPVGSYLIRLDGDMGLIATKQ